MAAAIGLRNDYGSGGLQAAAKRSKDGPQARRLLALAAITTAPRTLRRRRSGASGCRSFATGWSSSTRGPGRPD
jgi:hypothetical protein